MRCVLVLVAILFPGAAWADACNDFNLFRFSPNELERCIKYLKFGAEIADKRIDLLELQLCEVARELAAVRPAANHLVTEFCPKPRPQKRTK